MRSMVNRQSQNLPDVDEHACHAPCATHRHPAVDRLANRYALAGESLCIGTHPLNASRGNVGANLSMPGRWCTTERASAAPAARQRRHRDSARRYLTAVIIRALAGRLSSRYDHLRRRPSGPNTALALRGPVNGLVAGNVNPAICQPESSSLSHSRATSPARRPEAAGPCGQQFRPAPAYPGVHHCHTPPPVHNKSSMPGVQRA